MRGFGSARRVKVTVAIAVLVATFGCERASIEEPPLGDAGTVLGDTTVATLPVLLDLGSDSCSACKTMAPILDEMKETLEGQIHVRFVDVRKNRSVAAEHGVKVIPTQIFFDEDGRELFRHQGFFGREDILAKWTELGYTFDDAAPRGTGSDG